MLERITQVLQVVSTETSRDSLIRVRLSLQASDMGFGGLTCASARYLGQWFERELGHPGIECARKSYGVSVLATGLKNFSICVS
jgi:hypothetical protein